MNSLVSVIIPTKNSSRTIEACLESVEKQSYPNIEIIVVDNNSTDETKEIAQNFQKSALKLSTFNFQLLNFGPERSAQRNYGVKESNGEYVLLIDSDMVLAAGVVENCVKKIQSDVSFKAIIIPEESFGEGFWAQCKKLEKSYYLGVEWMEAARFFEKELYLRLGGYNEEMVSGEDWDLSQRVEKVGQIGRIDNFIYHNEGAVSLLKSVKKKYYYAGKFSEYKKNNINENKVSKQTSIISRYKLFFSQPSKILKNPILWGGMIFIKTCEFGFGRVGLLIGNKSR